MTDWQLGLMMFIVSIAYAIAVAKIQKRSPVKRWERIVSSDVIYRMILLVGFAGTFLFWRGLLIEVPLPGLLLLVLASLLSAITFLGVYVPLFRRFGGGPPSGNKRLQSEFSDLIEGIRKK